MSNLLDEKIVPSTLCYFNTLCALYDIPLMSGKPRQLPLGPIGRKLLCCVLAKVTVPHHQYADEYALVPVREYAQEYACIMLCDGTIGWVYRGLGYDLKLDVVE